MPTHIITSVLDKAKEEFYHTQKVIRSDGRGTNLDKPYQILKGDDTSLPEDAFVEERDSKINTIIASKD